MKKNLPLLVLIIGLIFRIIFPGHCGVNFDQIQIIKEANSITHGDLSLIGPRTGPAKMFTGPLIYYLAVPFVLIFGEYATIALVPFFIATLTGVSIYLLFKKYIGKEEALISIIIWAFSPFLITLDRIFWNPNLIFLSSLFVLIPILKNKDNKLSLLLIFLGSFLAYQAHFSGFVLLFLAFISSVFNKSIKQVITIILGFLLSIGPTIIFDIRNNFLNTKGLLNLLDEKSTFNISSLLKDFIHNLYVISETQGKIFLYQNKTALIISLGLLILLSSVFLIKKQLEIKKAIIWIIGIAFIYSFYRASKPEYYYLIVFPSLFFISAKLIKSLNLNFKKVLFLFFAVSSTLINIKLLKINSGMTIKNITDLEKKLNQKEVKQIIYDVANPELGAEYFLNKLELNENGDIYHIAYPNDLSFAGIQAISDVALWQDQRKENKNYIVKNSYFLETDSDVFLYENIYPKSQKQKYDSYKVIKNNKLLGELNVATENKDQIDWVKECLEQKEIRSWVSKNKQYIKFESGHCLVLSILDDNQIDPQTISLW